MSHNLVQPHPILPSNRKFGWFFAALFIVGSARARWENHLFWSFSLLALAVIFVVLTIVAPQVLAPLNRLWFALGNLLGRIVSPIVLGIIFFVLITPIAVIARSIGRDALLIKKRTVSSYWLDRNPIGPAPESFKNQF